MDDQKTTLPPISTAARNCIASWANSLDRPAPAERVAPLPRVSDYARRLGYVPEPIRQRMPRPA